MYSKKTSNFLKIVCMALLFGFIISVLGTFSIQAKANTDRYCGYGNTGVPYAAVSTETVNYTNREVTTVEIPKGVPPYTQISSLKNSCGPTAGAIIVGYYDKTKTNLITNYTPCLTSGKFFGNVKCMSLN